MNDGGTTEDRLTRAAAARDEARSLRSRLAAAADFAAQARRRAAELSVALGDEERDVERLESLSWVRIWATLRGGRATDLERESAERDAARYAAREADHRAAMAEAEVQALTAQLEALGDVDAAWAQALDAKAEWLRGQPGPEASRLAELAARRGELAGRRKENREAQEAGGAAHQALGAALELVSSAASWSTFDAFGGGGLLTDMVKYDKLERAQGLIRAADGALARFAHELADVGVAGVDGVEIDGLTRTFDVWFDNIFSDLAVRSRIQDARHRLEHASGAVQQVLAGLRADADDLERQVGALDREREHLLRSA